MGLFTIARSNRIIKEFCTTYTGNTAVGIWAPFVTLVDAFRLHYSHDSFWETVFFSLLCSYLHLTLEERSSVYCEGSFYLVKIQTCTESASF